MADIDAALGQEILDVAQRQRVSHVHHHDQTDDLRRAIEIAERVAHGLKLPRRDAAGLLSDSTLPRLARALFPRPSDRGILGLHAVQLWSAILRDLRQGTSRIRPSPAYLPRSSPRTSRLFLRSAVHLVSSSSRGLRRCRNCANSGHSPTAWRMGQRTQDGQSSASGWAWRVAVLWLRPGFGLKSAARSG